MSAHTPGPWHVAVDKRGHLHITAATRSGLQKSVARVGGYCRADRDANARLIAAAPVLLAALRTFIAQCDKSGDFKVRHGTPAVEGRAAIQEAVSAQWLPMGPS